MCLFRRPLGYGLLFVLRFVSWWWMGSSPVGRFPSFSWDFFSTSSPISVPSPFFLFSVSVPSFADGRLLRRPPMAHVCWLVTVGRVVVGYVGWDVPCYLPVLQESFFSPSGMRRIPPVSDPPPSDRWFGSRSTLRSVLSRDRPGTFEWKNGSKRCGTHVRVRKGVDGMEQ